MIRCNSVLFIDNDCLVNIFDGLYYTDRSALVEVIDFLALSYDQIWIPKTVEWEFYYKQEDNRKRRKILSWVLGNYRFINRCPINVSRKEITQMMIIADSDAGETDAIIQIKKTMLSRHHRINRIIFFSHDKGALGIADSLDIEVLDFRDFEDRLKEIGIILPC